MRPQYLLLSSLLLSIAAIETVFRVVAYDFSGEGRAQRRLPIFYRQPRIEVGEVFFRRFGPANWHGNALAEGLSERRGIEVVYDHLPEWTISYDQHGFRNPPELVDWDIVVAGDSFLELGYLSFEELYTTVLGQRLDRRVKNLGVSFTGNLSHCHCLRHYGGAPSSKDAVLVFFEGNDLTDTLSEFEAVRVFRRTGRRPHREIREQTSFVKALVEAAKRVIEPAPADPLPELAKAWFVTDQGESEVTIGYVPPIRISAPQLAALESALTCWAATARSQGMEPWLLYVPAKRRVLHGHLRFSEDAAHRFRQWQPRDFPRSFAHMVRNHGIGVINPLPVLVRAIEDGVLTYNSVWDTHLNRAGSRLVAEAMAAALSKKPD